MHDVAAFFAVHDLPPAETFVPLSGAPPLSAPNVTTTVKLTLPFLIGLLVIELIVGALGLVTDLTAALAGAVTVAIRTNDKSVAKRFMLLEYNAFCSNAQAIMMALLNTKGPSIDN